MATLYSALFGVLERAQLIALRDAGFHIITTDGPAEAATRDATAKLKLRPIIRPAAWTILDHETSVVTNDRDRNGDPREYNRNGGFTRDALVVDEAHLVVIGSGVGGRRLGNILDTAKKLNRTVKQLVAVETAATEATPEQVEEAIAKLPF